VRLAREARGAEVDELDAAAREGGEQDVLRLEVAVIPEDKVAEVAEVVEAVEAVEAAAAGGGAGGGGGGGEAAEEVVLEAGSVAHTPCSCRKERAASVWRATERTRGGVK
jgi:hypothetical protein